MHRHGVTVLRRHAGSRCGGAGLRREQPAGSTRRPTRPAGPAALSEVHRQGDCDLRRKEARVSHQRHDARRRRSESAQAARQASRQMRRHRRAGCRRRHPPRRRQAVRRGRRRTKHGGRSHEPARRAGHAAGHVGGSGRAERRSTAAQHRHDPHRRPAVRYDRAHPLDRRRDAGHAERPERAGQSRRDIPEQLCDDRPLRTQPGEPARGQVLTYDRRARQQRRRWRLQRLRRHVDGGGVAAGRRIPHRFLRQVHQRLQRGRAVHPTGLGRVARLRERRLLQLHPGRERRRGRFRRCRHRLLDRRAARPGGAVHPRLRRRHSLLPLLRSEGAARTGDPRAPPRRIVQRHPPLAAAQLQRGRRDRQAGVVAGDRAVGRQHDGHARHLQPDAAGMPAGGGRSGRGHHAGAARHRAGPEHARHVRFRQRLLVGVASLGAEAVPATRSACACR